MRAKRLVLTTCFLGCAVSSPARSQPHGVATTTNALLPIAGATIGPIESSLWRNRGYGTEASAETLDHLRSLGVRWIAITPFGRVAHTRAVDILPTFEADLDENRKAVGRVIQQAKARGFRVLVVPHLWVEQGGWRGAIDPGSPTRWRRYQRSFTRFIKGWARVAAQGGADAFSIGVECKSWSWRDKDVWLRLIEDVRRIFPGALTYSANWDEVDQVVFWEALDWIGVNAFYPLADHPSATDETYRKNAARIAVQLSRTAALHQRPIVFTEVGYANRKNSAVEPWKWPDHMTDVELDETEPTRAFGALLNAFIAQPWFGGFFVWRYYASLNDLSQEPPWGFSPFAKDAEEELRQLWRRTNEEVRDSAF